MTKAKSINVMYLHLTSWNMTENHINMRLFCQCDIFLSTQTPPLVKSSIRLCSHSGDKSEKHRV